MNKSYFKEHPYSEEEALEESEKISENVRSGKAKDYSESNAQIDNEQSTEFFEKWRKNPEPIYEKNSEILNDLVNGIEEDLIKKKVFDFNILPKLWIISLS